MSVKRCGSGSKRRMAGSRNASTSSASTPRPASTRAKSSGTPWRCAMVSATARPRASRRSRQTRPVAERATPRKSHPLPSRAGSPMPLAQVEFIELAVLGLHPAHGPGDGAHDDCFSFDHVFSEFHAREHRPVGYAGSSEQAVASDHVLDLVFLFQVGDAHFAGALA